MALVDVRRAYFYAPARRSVFVELPPEDCQPGDEHMCGLLRYNLYGTRDAAQNWEEELATKLSNLKLTIGGSACPCVWRGHIKGEDIVATVHGDVITIGGERSAVEFHIRMISKKYEIKKQVIGKNPDFEKSGRILNRVIEWNRDGITIEAHQRHVRDILKGLELERPNRSATPCAVERKDEGKGESRRGQGQTQTEHEWDNANNSDDRDRQQMADDDDRESQALTNGDITRYRALVARISYFSQDRPDLKFASMQVDCKTNDAGPGTRQEDRTIPRWEAEGMVLVPLAAEW